jgi:phosphoglycolate phosphatase
MIQDLKIPVEHASNLTEWDGLLITVDCQYGAENVSRVAAPCVAVIDHHVQENGLPSLCDLRPCLGSCSTLVWRLLEEASFLIDARLGTALHYGLYSDTGGFAELRHPLDRDMLELLTVDQRILKKLKGANLSLSDLTVASAALKDFHLDAEKRFVIVSVPPCDPYLLGFIGDLSMQVDAVDLAVVYSEMSDGIKFSVRSALREAKASDLAAWLAGDIGSGGGLGEKAGGCISTAKYRERFDGKPLALYFSESLRESLASCVIVDCSSASASAENEPFMKLMKPYRKRHARVGFVPCHRLFNGRTALRVRMLDGDMDITVDGETVLMIGLSGEVHPMEFEKFIETYNLTGERFSGVLPYPPAALDKSTGLRVSLPEFADTCVNYEEEMILAARLESRVKVFTYQNGENYVQGVPGDWIVARHSPDDLSIIAADVFPRLYARDYTNENLSAWKGSIRAVKKSVLVAVTFAAEPGILYTSKGPAPYRKGDALLTGTLGDAWPMSLEQFREAYEPAPGTPPGAAGKYSKSNLSVRALRINEPFSTAISAYSKKVLWGEQGDWLLQYEPDEYGVVIYGVVSGEAFDKTYDVYAENTNPLDGSLT